LRKMLPAPASGRTETLVGALAGIAITVMLVAPVVCGCFCRG
jgi:hypothetical protein